MSDDVYGHYVKLLLEMDGENNSTDIHDTSPTSRTVSVYGNAALNTATKKYGNSSCYFDGNGDYLSVPNSDAFTFGTNAFTVECWIYLTTTIANNVTYGIVSTYAGNYYGWSLQVNDVAGQDRMTFTYTLGADGQGDGTGTITQNTTWAANTWYHLAVSRTGSTIYLCIDGTANSKSANARFYNGSDNTMDVGRRNGTAYFPGYIQGLRITNGIARYTENFTPSAAALPAPDPFVGPIFNNNLRYDLQDGGLYRVIGTVTELGQAGIYKVRLFDRQSGRCVRETWSNAAGAYSFNDIAYRANGYFAVAYDHGNNPLNAAIADLITPEIMP